MKSVERRRLRMLIERETLRFVNDHPVSRRMSKRARAHLIGGVPMNWMLEWPGPFPVFGSNARGAWLTDVDGHRYIDFCLGDTGAMFGHALSATVRAVARQLRRGTTTMLPTEDSIFVGRELTRRFRLPYWQFAMTATDANRFALRMAREATGRRKVLVFHGCYHGTVDETLVRLQREKVVPRECAMPPPVDPGMTTKVVEFNDVEGLKRALAPGDVAAVLMEPALTNCGIVLPQDGYLTAVREITRQTGTLWILDETHTLCVGPGGYTARERLDPDMVTLGKSIGGGIPSAAFGSSRGVYAKTAHNLLQETGGENGVGGTLAANALSVAAMRATFERTITGTAFRHTIPLAARWADGVRRAIERIGLPWHVVQLGARAEYLFRKSPPKNGSEAIAARDVLLSQYLHLAALNRRILLTPFHNMALMCPATTPAQVDHHSKVFDEIVEGLAG